MARNETKYMESVIALSEELNFTLAAQKMHVKGVAPQRIQHVTGPEEAFPGVAEGSWIAFVVKAGALRIARDGVTVRPLVEDSLSLKTYLISRSDNQSKAVSALVRSFMRQLESTQVGRQRPVAVPA